MDKRLTELCMEFRFSKSKVQHRSLNLCRCVIPVPKLTNRPFMSSNLSICVISVHKLVPLYHHGSLNYKIKRLRPQICSIISFRSLNLILNLIWVKTRRSKIYISKTNSYFFHMNLNEDKFYIKMVALGVIYNFVVEIFLN